MAAMLDKLSDLSTRLRMLDSGAESTSVAHLLRGPTPRHALMHPLIVPIAIALYLLLKRVLDFLCARLGTTGQSTLFRRTALLHNALLCVFSVWTASNVLPRSVRHLRRGGLDAVLCDNSLWHDGIGYFGFLFYLSKYWELLDSMLLIVKRREPSFLQVYHHTMTIVCAYLLQSSHSSSTFIFVGLNSTVHSVMYAYYALTTLGYRFGAKSLITSMQIVQFFTGIGTAMPSFFLRGGRCCSVPQQIATGSMILHAVYLIKLFSDFYRETYQRNKIKSV